MSYADDAAAAVAAALLSRCRHTRCCRHCRLSGRHYCLYATLSAKMLIRAKSATARCRYYALCCALRHVVRATPLYADATTTRIPRSLISYAECRPYYCLCRRPACATVTLLRCCYAMKMPCHDAAEALCRYAAIFHDRRYADGFRIRC